MCSIFGLISLSNKFNTSELLEQCKLASNTMIYRGPDNSGIYNYKNTYLAHNRLSIIDLRRIANQPMLSEDNKNVLIFNGEIYNHNQLSTAFTQLGTLSDTEVLLQYLIKYGINETLTKIEGMFAFGYLNKKENILTIARDRSGIKPLYWMKDDNFFIFSSDLKALKKIKNINLEVDRNSVSSFLRFNYIPAPHSIYKNVYKLEPGEYLTFNLKNNKISKTKYFVNSPSNSSKALTFENFYEELKIELNVAVKKCLISDLDVGTFLSGGIDSTLITSIANRSSQKKVNTFYIGFEEDEYDERVYAEYASQIIGTNHQEIFLNKSVTIDIAENLSDIYDEPFADSSQIPTFLLCKYAKRKNTVILSGDGGDEMFGGYHRYNYVKNLYYLRKIIPEFFIKFIQNNLSLLPKSFVNNFNLSKRFQTLLKANDMKEIYLNSISHTTNPDELVIKSKEHKLNYDFINQDLSIFLFMKYHDFNYYLPNDILNKIDRASMYNSMEVRVPLLEINLLNFLHQSSLKYQNRYFDKKILLIKILKERHPSLLDKGDFFSRNKLGLGCAIQNFMSTVLKSYFDEIVNEDNIKKFGILNYKNVKKLLDYKNKKGEFVNFFLVWNIFVFQQWCNKNL